MLKILISGCNGHMGQVVAQICRESGDVEVAAGFDLLGQEREDFPVYSSPAAFQGQADALIDFSSPAALPALLELGAAGGPAPGTALAHCSHNGARRGAARLELQT